MSALRAALSLRHDRSATVNRHRVEHPGRQFVTQSKLQPTPVASPKRIVGPQFALQSVTRIHFVPSTSAYYLRTWTQAEGESTESKSKNYPVYNLYTDNVRAASSSELLQSKGVGGTPNRPMDRSSNINGSAGVKSIGYTIRTVVGNCVASCQKASRS